ncbi:transposase, partial [Epilithonimonas arachidiradicis]
MGISKYSLSFKLSCIERIAKHNLSVHSLAREIGLDASMIRKWKRFYDLYGIQGLQRRSNRSYDAKFKLRVLETTESQNLSLKQAAARFNIAA